MTVSRTHRLLFVGDVVLNSKPYFSADLERIVGDSVIRCCNVEAPLRGFGTPVRKTGPWLDQDPRCAEWLNALGFNLFAMANNHIHDFGDEGLRATQQAFGPENVIGIGTGDEAYALHTKNIDGVRYGFLAYGENGYGALNGDTKIGYAWINHERVNADIAVSKAQVDVLIVQVHCGVELLDVPIPEWKKRCYEIIDQGADIVIGHHPHILQGIEVYKNKPICYSLGNFCFDYPSLHPQWNTGGVLQIEVKEGEIEAYSLQVVEKDGQEVRLWDKDRSEKKIQELNIKLGDDSYQDYVNREALARWNAHHTKYYAKAVNGLVDYSIMGILKHIKRIIFNRKVGYNMMWHNLFIESNLWLVQRAIRQLKNR
ncbi:MAG TPA: CapA family protein [Sphingobacterium sp.]|nr:CapA family protein [Sphingobacterium sp.]